MLFGDREVIERDHVTLGGGLVEVRLDDEPGIVRRDKRWVFEVFAVLLQLGEGGFEVAVLALVLEGEEVFLPDVGPAVAALALGGTALERERRAGLVAGDGRGVADELAEVIEVGDVERTLLERHAAPLVDERRRGHHRDCLAQDRPCRPTRVMRPNPGAAVGV